MLSTNMRYVVWREYMLYSCDIEASYPRTTCLEDYVCTMLGVIQKPHVRVKCIL